MEKMSRKSFYRESVFRSILCILFLLVMGGVGGILSHFLLSNVSGQTPPIQVWFVDGETVGVVKDKNAVLNWTLYVKNALPTEPTPITVNCNVTVSAEVGSVDISNSSFTLAPGATFAVNITLYILKGSDAGEKSLTALVNATYSKGLGLVAYPVTNSTTYYIMPYAQVRLRAPEGNVSQSSEAGKDVVYNILLNNTGNAEEFVRISIEGVDNLTASGWNFSYYSGETRLTMDEETALSITVKTPGNTKPGAYQFVVTATARVEVPPEYKNSTYNYTTSTTSKSFTLTITSSAGGAGNNNGGIPTNIHFISGTILSACVLILLYSRRKVLA